MKNHTDEIICGVDPGYSGAFVFTKNNEVLLQKKIIIDNRGLINSKLMYSELSKWDNLKNCKKVIIEHPHSIYGIAISANWKLAESFGSLYTFCTQYFDSVVPVRPKAWQKQIIRIDDIVEKPNGKKDTKKTAMRAGRRLFPLHDFRDLENKPKSKVFDHNFVDGALISLYKPQ